MRRFMLAVLLVISLLFTSCKNTLSPPTQDKSFLTFTNRIFQDFVQNDSLTLNYTLKNPKNFQITKLPQGFPTPSANRNTSYSETENLLSRLQCYKKEDLSLEEQILHDTMTDYLTREVKRIPYEKYFNTLNPSNGIQAQLPVLLAEFHLDDKEDVEQYFLLLKSIPDYFNQLLTMETEKKNAKTLPSQTTMQHTIEQCQHFLSQNGCEMIRSAFKQQIEKNHPNEAASYQQKHDLYLNQYLVPSYQKIISTLTALLPYAPPDGSLAAYPNGKQYYTCLFQDKSGSYDSVSVWKNKLEKRLKKAEDSLLSCAAKSPSAFLSCEDYQKKYSSAEEILTTLQQKIASDFPSCSNTSYQLHSVDSSLEDYLSPAFYLTPPIDDTSTNDIYINQSPAYQKGSLFNTLAHEAYPGHLYQNCYMRQQNLPLLRYVMDFPAYTEGYATYAEIYSYRYTGASDIEVSILQNNAISTHCLYALCVQCVL